MTTLRRAALAAALALVLPLPIAGAATAASPPAATAAALPPALLTPELPHPTGPFTVGLNTLHLVDTHRQDPWVPAAGPRQLMVSLFYPARPGTGGPAPYMTTAGALAWLRQDHIPNAADLAPALSATHSWAYTDARPAPGRFPLVLLSPGLTMPRATLTSVAVDLTSRGYVVALVDHTYEAPGITFPDGRTPGCVICDRPPAGGPEAVALSRAKDLSFVIDRLTDRHPSWPYARLIDPRRIGLAGHSIGGDAAAATMAADRRVRAGADLDGTLFAPIPATGLGGRPFLLLGAQADESPGQDPSWTQGWTRLDGWKRWLTIAGAQHGSFTDVPLLASQAGLPEPPTPLSPTRGLQLTHDYLGSFFDLQLKGIPRPLLDGPSPANPEITFQYP
ncbi:alpha/beta hydrolase [Streptomyces sp. NBC_00536]|uniref:alpha/beta hydrolase family protein n=1 Tax=Streptomyces sp. NBC_00536 TaxID=2975769 RepID=UPI002E81306C|nr:alpha/beta hydrolase [Streptomyces sp. NBC_00536]WUC83022.1 alpha/beta hydrolase [Streptomyces sp. NBC_00536]